eukprot:Gb_32844 [translate_table: standard]
MDSLLANYASSDEEDNQPQVPNPSPVKSRGSLFASLPPPKDANLPPKRSIFASLPSPKNPTASLKAPQTKAEEEGIQNSTSSFSSMPPPKGTSAFSLPPPKNKSAGAKRLVEFKPPVNRALLENQDDDDDEPAAKKRAISESKALGGGLTALLPPPKNSLGSGTALGGGSAGGRRSFLETASSTDEPNTNLIDEPSPAPPVDQTVYASHGATEEHPGEIDGNAYYDCSGVYATESSSQGNLASDDAALSHGSYYNANHEYPQNWPAQEDTHNWDNGSAQMVQQHSMGAGSNLNKAERRRGRNEIPTNIVEVKQDQLISNRPREDQVKMTGIAFGPSYQPASSSKDKPSKLHKRKHQIGSLYFDLKQREMELAERRARGQLTKAETQAKYGW